MSGSSFTLKPYITQSIQEKAYAFKENTERQILKEIKKSLEQAKAF